MEELSILIVLKISRLIYQPALIIISWFSSTIIPNITGRFNYNFSLLKYQHLLYCIRSHWAWRSVTLVQYVRLRHAQPDICWLLVKPVSVTLSLSKGGFYVGIQSETFDPAWPATYRPVSRLHGQRRPGSPTCFQAEAHHAGRHGRRCRNRRTKRA